MGIPWSEFEEARASYCNLAKALDVGLACGGSHAALRLVGNVTSLTAQDCIELSQVLQRLGTYLRAREIYVEMDRRMDGAWNHTVNGLQCAYEGAMSILGGNKPTLASKGTADDDNGVPPQQGG